VQSHVCTWRCVACGAQGHDAGEAPLGQGAEVDDNNRTSDSRPPTPPTPVLQRSVRAPTHLPTHPPTHPSGASTTTICTPTHPPTHPPTPPTPVLQRSVRPGPHHLHGVGRRHGVGAAGAERAAGHAARAQLLRVPRVRQQNRPVRCAPGEGGGGGTGRGCTPPPLTCPRVRRRLLAQHPRVGPLHALHPAGAVCVSRRSLARPQCAPLPSPLPPPSSPISCLVAQAHTAMTCGCSRQVSVRARRGGVGRGWVGALPPPDSRSQVTCPPRACSRCRRAPAGRSCRPPPPTVPTHPAGERCHHAHCLCVCTPPPPISCPRVSVCVWAGPRRPRASSGATCSCSAARGTTTSPSATCGCSASWPSESLGHAPTARGGGGAGVAAPCCTPHPASAARGAP
jgi:hypothetical protein